MADLPTELYSEIFEPLRPIFKSHIPVREGHKDRSIYKKAVRQYADLRLISSRLNKVLVPSVYTEIVVYIDKNTRLAGLASVFEHGANHIRRLIIVGSHQFAADRQDSAVAQVIGRGLRLCLRVNHLECYGYHHLFASRNWLHKTAPNLASTVTSLIFSPNLELDLSYSLLGLSTQLRNLEIHFWTERRQERPPFHLPSTMHGLTTLSLFGGSPRVKDVEKLITRATRKKTPNSEPASGLRSLVICRVPILDADNNMMAILSINKLHLRLTVFHWYPACRANPHVISVVKACPNLVDFLYTGFASNDLLCHLPPKLEHLGLHASYNNVDQVPADDLVTYIKSERCQALRTVTLIMDYGMDSRRFGDACVSSTCLGVGISYKASDC